MRERWSPLLRLGTLPLATLLLVAAEIALWGYPRAGLVSVTLVAAALLARRRVPEAAALAVAAAPFVERALGGPWLGPVAPLTGSLFAAYAVAAHAPRARAV